MMGIYQITQKYDTGIHIIKNSISSFNTSGEHTISSTKCERRSHFNSKSSNRSSQCRDSKKRTDNNTTDSKSANSKHSGSTSTDYTSANRVYSKRDTISYCFFHERYRFLCWVYSRSRRFIVSPNIYRLFLFYNLTFLYLS